jgi:hypothetical protein
VRIQMPPGTVTLASSGLSTAAARAVRPLRAPALCPSATIFTRMISIALSPAWRIGLPRGARIDPRARLFFPWAGRENALRTHLRASDQDYDDN